MQFELLDTKRLILRKITNDVMCYVFQNNSHQEQLDFLGLSTDAELEVERVKFEEGLSTHNKKFLYFQLLNPATNKVIGWCGFHTWYTDHSRAEIGYGLYNDEDKGKGLMTEAMVVVLKYGFEEMNLHRVEAFIGTQNAASQNLVKKWKFVREGQLREHYRSNGILEDSVVFSLLKTEYLKLNK